MKWKKNLRTFKKKHTFVKTEALKLLLKTPIIMSAIISIGLSKEKLIFNEKGWANITIFLDDETNTYGQNASAIIEQTKEQREAKEPRHYLGNGKVLWTDGQIKAATRLEKQVSGSQQSTAGRQTPDLPF